MSNPNNQANEVTANNIFPTNDVGSVRPVQYRDKDGRPQHAVTIMKLGKNQKMNMKFAVRKGIGK